MTDVAPAPRMPDLDPGVELLPDVPIGSRAEDLFDRGRVAVRLVELAVAQPIAAPRAIALTGGFGAGKSSVLQIAIALVAERAGCALIAIDAAMYANAQGLSAALAAELMRLFDDAGVIETTDKVRSTLASYGDIVSSLLRFAGAKVDVAGALEKSAEALRTELATNLEQIGKRLVIVIDHVDRFAPAELSATLAALGLYARVPYISIVLAVDRRHVALRLRDRTADPRAYERVVSVELALPPPDRLLLARVMARGLERIAQRLRRPEDNIDAVLPLFDPDSGTALDLIETPRDAKRAINAIAAALPLAPPDADPAMLCLETILRVLVPELDAARLDARPRATGAARKALLDELDHRLTGHRRVGPARAALRVLFGA